jgi:hypothetical protein
MPKPGSHGCAQFSSLALLLAPNSTVGVRSEIRSWCRCPLADNKVAFRAQPRGDTSLQAFSWSGAAKSSRSSHAIIASNLRQIKNIRW